MTTANTRTFQIRHGSVDLSNVHEEEPQSPAQPAATTEAVRVPTTTTTTTKSSSKVTPNNYGLTDDEFKKWLRTEFKNVPNRQVYNRTYTDSINAIVKWRQRYRGNPKLWKRLFKKDLVLKEVIEVVPVIDAVQTYMANVELNKQNDDENSSASSSSSCTILDLCSGKGYLSMLLSEILPPDKVEKIILVDKAWARCHAKELLPHHMNWDHIYGTIPPVVVVEEENEDEEKGAAATGVAGSVADGDGDCKTHNTENTYFTTWPIPLHTSKQNLKKASDHRGMKKFIFDEANGPILVLAIHLCGTLSLKSIQLFNSEPNVKFLALKPCCLPPMVHAQRKEVFSIGRHSFPALDVCSNGRFTSKTWTGPPRWHLEQKFHLWSDNLYKGIDIQQQQQGEGKGEPGEQTEMSTTNSNGKKIKEKINVQVDGGFQNTYLWAERSPITPNLWNKD
jgi:hypothetical protein